VSRHPQFHTLQVSAIDRLTDDAVALTFAVPADLADDYAFAPGQHVVVRCLAAGDDARRTYSLCAAPGVLRIAVKQVAHGVFSGHALAVLGLGDDVEVMTPMGRFTTVVDASRQRHRAAIVAGSRFTLIYGNRAAESVMFLDELADLKDRYPDRLVVFHVLSREVRDSPLLSGHLDKAKIDELLDIAMQPASVDEWFLCGPGDVIDAARASLRDHGVADDAVRFELFHVASGQPAPAAAAVASSSSADVTIMLAGRSTRVVVGPGQDVLHVVMTARPDVPYGCTNGMCGTCRARVVEGRVEMHHCYALDQAEIDAGFVLTCQARPRTDRVVLDYDA
jgi:ring-1,2-phenylacetyl-CoA epoxidase subunit PaaE